MMASARAGVIHFLSLCTHKGIACQVSMVSQNARLDACKISPRQVENRLLELNCSYFPDIIYIYGFLYPAEQIEL